MARDACTACHKASQIRSTVDEVLRPCAESVKLDHLVDEMEVGIREWRGGFILIATSRVEKAVPMRQSRRTHPGAQRRPDVAARPDPPQLETIPE